jgi:hypothetical protein
LFHVLGSSISSLDEIEETASFTTSGKYFLVKNFINDTSFFEWDQATHKSYFKKSKYAEEITVPKLREMAYEQVELASVPFTTFIAMRGYVRHWLGQVWDEYARQAQKHRYRQSEQSACASRQLFMTERS